MDITVSVMGWSELELDSDIRVDSSFVLIQLFPYSLLCHSGFLSFKGALVSGMLSSLRLLSLLGLFSSSRILTELDVR